MSSLGKKLAISSSLELKQEYTTARNTYFNTIKVAKTGHQNAFLEKEDPKSIFKAMAYTKDLLIQSIPSIRNASTNTLEDSFIGKYQAFKSTLFLNSPKAPEIDLSIETYATYASVEHVMRPHHMTCRRCYCRRRKGETKSDQETITAAVVMTLRKG